MPNVKDVIDDVVDEVEEAVEGFDLGSVLPLVLEKVGLPRGLDDILTDVLGDGSYDLRRALKRQLQRRVTAQEGRSGGELLGRALVKQIDFHYEVEANGLGMDARHVIISELAQNISRQLIIAADVILRYPETARDVNIAKARHDVKGLAAARQQRTFLVEDLKRALVNAARAAVGDDVIG